MERVAFLVEQSGERIGCMLNPESLVLRRWAGIRPLRSAGGLLSGGRLTEDPLLSTGGGITELRLNLLFDISIEGSSIQTDDVRNLTAPLWRLTESAIGEDDVARPPLARFIWGKTWNLCAVITALAERLERFNAEGKPARSWLRLRLRRVTEPGPRAVTPPPTPALLERTSPPQGATPDQAFIHETVGAGENQESGTEGHGGERLDEIAYRYYGNPAFWKVLAQYNALEDPMHLAPGQGLKIPSLKALGTTP